MTSAALVLFLAFMALASGPGSETQDVHECAPIGILLDATVIRVLIVPAAIAPMGRWNWWLSSWPAERDNGAQTWPDPDRAMVEPSCGSKPQSQAERGRSYWHCSTWASSSSWRLGRDGQPQWLVVVEMISTSRYRVRYPDGTVGEIVDSE